MRRKTRDTGRLKLIAFFIFVAVLLPKFLNARSTDNLGSFEAGETGIKLCARINNGNEDALRFLVTNDQGFTSDVIVAKDTCKTIEASAATFTIREYLPQEYVLDSVSGGTVSADAASFLATSAGQYAIIYENTFSGKPYLHNFGYTGSLATATAVGIIFDANGGTGSMDEQFFGLQAQQNLTANTFTREGYNFTGWNTKSDGTGTSYEDGHAFTFSEGGEYTLYAQWEEVPAEPTIADTIAEQANDPYEIDFTRKAIISDDVATANGNGVNAYTEKGQTIYYYRGQVNNNNVIWAGKCWKIVRTTYTGGVKLIYNGELDTEENFDGDMVPVNTCTDEDRDKLITYNGTQTASFSKDATYNSPADVGYMFGDRIELQELTVNGATFIFANNVSYDGTTYTLSTGSNAISGTWADKRLTAAVRYHYFCTDGAASCTGDKIGYIYYFGGSFYDSGTIYYLNINGYANIEAAKTAMFTNTTDSNAKATIEAWFEAENLDGHIASTRNYEDDLEDAIFCNDRTYINGSLMGKDGDAAASNGANEYGGYGRNVPVTDGNYHPSLDCTNKNDAFTKSDTTNGNGKLSHKVGLITADELTLAGTGYSGYDTTAYLYGASSWTMSPTDFAARNGSYGLAAGTKLSDAWMVNTGYANGFRPMVSLKSEMKFVDNGANGSATNPYIVEE